MNRRHLFSLLPAAALVPLLPMKPPRQGTHLAVQLSWATWGDVCAMGIISSDNPGRLVSEAADACDETGPFIEVTVPTQGGPKVARHGDWIARDPQGALSVYPLGAAA